MDTNLQKSPLPYLTTDYLLGLFKGYKHPRDKIKNLTLKGELINIKNGLYLLGGPNQRAYSKEVLSGMIFGPSAISFEYALSLHGLIPERVETVTCLCFKRDRSFDTPVGKFTYKYISKNLYPIGLNYCQTDLGNYFVASPEKAICDMAYFQKFKNEQEALEYVTEGLRIDKSELLNLNPSLLMGIAKRYKRASVLQLVDALIMLQSERKQNP